MKTGTILIVDDNKKNIQVLATTLSIEGYEVEYATSGKDGIEWLSQTKFDLILLDVMMPEMDGFETCTRIKSLDKNNDIPVIFITAKNDVDSISRGFEVGGVDYVSKPFNDKELLARVKTHIELKKHKDHLEELVSQRTLELNNALTELKTLDVAKSEFLNIINHELRTPLNGVLGFLSIIKNSSEIDQIQTYINFMDKSAKRLENFSNRALLITKLYTTDFSIQKKPMLSTVLEKEIDRRYSVAFTEKNIDFEFVTQSLECTVMGDAELLTQSIIEIIDNILLHAESTNKIIITITDKHISVTDNGAGFTEKALQDLFKPFGIGKTFVNNNVGLGLHFVKLAMDAHHYKVKAGNSENGGAFVRIIL